MTRLLAATALGFALAFAGCSKEPAIAEAPPAASQPAAQQPTIIRNFTLSDQNGKMHELYALKDAPAVVLIMQGVGCPIVQKMTPDLKAVEAAYEPKGVKFFMINSNMQDHIPAIAEEAKNFENHVPILKDADQSVGMQIGAVRTAETFIVDPKTWKIVYHGPLNDRLTYGREKAKAENDYAAKVLDAVLAGQEVPVIEQQADGCIINFPKRT